MSTLTIHLPHEVRKGDRIVALGGKPIPVERIVMGSTRDAILLDHPSPNPHGVEWRLYVDDFVTVGLTIEREDFVPVAITPNPRAFLPPARLKPHYTKLPDVSHGYTRIPDKLVEGGAGGYDKAAWVRMVRCDTCEKEIASLGIGYHRQNTGH